MTRGVAITVLAAVALAARTQLFSDLAAALRLSGRVDTDRGRAAARVEPSSKAGAAPTMAGQPETATSLDVEPPMPLGGGDGMSIPDSGFDASTGSGRSVGDWRSALEQLDEVLERWSASSLDFFLDLDLGVADDGQTPRAARTSEPIPEAVLTRADPTPVERQTPALLVDVGPGRGGSGSGAAAARDVATAPPAVDAPRGSARDRVPVTGGATLPDPPHGSSVELEPARGVVAPPPSRIDSRPDASGMPNPSGGRDEPPAFGARPTSDQRFTKDPTFSPRGDLPTGLHGARPSLRVACDGGPCSDDRVPVDNRGPDFGPPGRRLEFAGSAITPEDGPCDDARCDDGDPCTLDRCLARACVHEPIPGSAAVCGVRALVMARQRLLDEAPPGAFVDAASRSRVRVGLGRALRSIDGALTRFDDAKSHGGAAHPGSVGRRIAVYEKRVGSRGIERDLVDAGLTRTLHFPVVGLAAWR